MKDTETFSFWRRPWEKWVVLAGALILLWALWRDVQALRAVSEAGMHTAASWSSYVAERRMDAAFKGIFVVVCLGFLAIGELARNRRAANWAAGWLLLASALTWGAVGLVFLRAVYRGAYYLFWIWFLLLPLIGGIHALRTSRNRP